MLNMLQLFKKNKGSDFLQAAVCDPRNRGTLRMDLPEARAVQGQVRESGGICPFFMLISGCKWVNNVVAPGGYLAV